VIASVTTPADESPRATNQHAAHHHDHHHHSSGGTAASGAGSRLALRADPSGALRFDKKTLDASSGKVTIVMKNPASLSHNVSIEGSGVNEMGETVGQGGTSTVSANLKPGRYTFYCSVPGHREGGMVGTLTVR
jgi:uncharacterized cupredoxin-like copper-binding protein